MEKPSKEVLEKLYLEENKSLKDLSSLFGVKKQNIQQWLFKYRIVKQKKDKKPSRENLYHEYVQLNKSIKDLTLKYAVCKNTIESWLSKYKIKKGKDKAFKCLKQTLNKKYNVSNSFNIKGVSEKIVETNLRKYGCKKYSQTEEYKVRVKKTNLDKYGYAFPNQNEEIKRKVKDTCLKRYNATSYISSKEYKDTLYSAHKVFNINQKHIPRATLDILYNKNKLLEVIKSLYSKTFVSLGNALGVYETTAAHYVRKHSLDYLMDSCTSFVEQEIKNIFNDIPLRKDRKVLDGQEIDLYSDVYKIGIEFNGDYWHTDKFKDKFYHYNKSKLAESKGVFIFHIFEHEWKDLQTKQAIVNRLRNIFNLNTNKIHARKCTLKEVSSKEANIFLNENHIQGSAPSQIRLGLYYNDELVSLMEFITNGINKNYQYELSRFCSKSGYNIVGGASKLFKHFIKTYNPKSIISYSDIAKTTGKIYETLGFKMDHISKPQYHWTDGDTIFTRYQTQLKQLREHGWLKEGENKSESQVMHEHRFYRIYDCGKKVWVWQL